MTLTKGDLVTVVTASGDATTHNIISYVPTRPTGGVTASGPASGGGKVSFFLPDAGEGTLWIRGHHSANSLDVRALMAAHRLTR